MSAVNRGLGSGLECGGHGTDDREDFPKWSGMMVVESEVSVVAGFGRAYMPCSARNCARHG